MPVYPRPVTRRPFWPLLLAALFLIAGCSAQSQVTIKSTVEPTSTPPVSTPSPLLAQNDTPTPSFTAAASPTTTDLPTDVPPTMTTVVTASPTATASPTSRPIPRATLPSTPRPLAPSPNESAGDPYYPQLGNGGYDAQHYTLDLSTDPRTNRLTATLSMLATATTSLPSLSLDLHGLSVSHVTVQSQPAVFRQNHDKLEITPSASIRAGTTFTTAITYSGVPEHVRSKAVPIEVGWTQYPGGSYVASEPDGAATWFPVNDHPRDKALYTFHITVPKPYVAAANGLLKNTIDKGTSRTFTWETSHPVASYLVTVNIAKFTSVTGTTASGIPIRSFFPTTLSSAAAKAFSRTGEMLDFFSTKFGPYPFETYGVVMADTNLDFALETQTLSLFGRDMATPNYAGSQIMEAHELAHQWFGDSVSVKNWRDIWLAEGFATFGQWLWQGHADGKAAYETAVRKAYSQMASDPVPPPAVPLPDDLFNPSVYTKGGLTLVALRYRLGDDLFFRVLQTYARRYRDSNASTDDFKAVVREVTHQNLDDFFSAWLYTSNLPPIPELKLSAHQ